MKLSTLKLSLLAVIASGLHAPGHTQQTQFSIIGLPFELEADRRPTMKTNGNILVKASRILTSTGKILVDTDVLVQNGKIVSIGKNLKADATFTVIDAKGMVLTSGIVDAHLHRGLDNTNEGSDAITAEVRTRDVIDGDDKSLWQALASGETSGLLLHGSANPIGGESVVVKLKYGKMPWELPIPDAPRMIKFALGENVTRAGSPTNTRFPHSRLGVEAVYRRAFQEAKVYMAAWDEYTKNPKGKMPRKDVRLETLSDILRQKVWVQCHSYRTDEILMMAKLSKELGFRIGAMQHALEAYKVAPELAELGVPVSTFSDHWSYKLEAYDANPANAAICMKAGVLTSINTDGTGGTTAVIHDAGRLMRNGGLTAEQCLEMITINPAKQLGIDKQTGSIEIGKDADFAIWDAHPFDVRSKCMMTFIEGELYFQRKDVFNVGANPDRVLDLKEPSSVAIPKTPAIASRYALTGATVYPISGPPITNGTVLIEKGKIVEVGRSVSIPGGTSVIDCTGMSIYPGLIDSGSALGLSEIEQVAVSIDLGEEGDFQPDLTALSAVFRDSAHFGTTLCSGVTTALTRPAGGLIPGQASVLNTYGWSTENMKVAWNGGLMVNMPGNAPRPPRNANKECDCFGATMDELWDNPRLTHDANNDGIHDHGQTEFIEEPMGPFATQVPASQPTQAGPPALENASGRLKILSDYWDSAVKYDLARTENPNKTVDLQLEAMRPYVTGKLPVIMRCRTVQAIRNAMEFGKNYKLKGVLCGAIESWKIAREVKASGFPVMIKVAGESVLGGNSPTSASDPYDTPYTVPYLLQKAGIKWAFMSEDNAMTMDLPERAGMSLAYGLTEDQAIRALTLSSAEILGISDRLGSLQVGKDATLIVTTGCPVLSTSIVKYAFVSGRPAPLISKHTRMRDEYMQRLSKGEQSIRKPVFTP